MHKIRLGCKEHPLIALIAQAILTLLLVPYPSFGDRIPHQQGEHETKVEVLTLQNALSLALSGSPELEDYSWEIRASEARLLQADLLPNPELSFELENFAGSRDHSGTDRAEATVLLNQLVELGGKRSARVNIANKQQERSALAYQHKRAQVLAEVKNKYFHVAADQEKVTLTKEATKLIQATIRHINNRIRAGKGSSVEADKAAILLAQSNIAKEHAEHELLSAKLRLASTWGAEKAQFKRVSIDIFKRTKVPSYDELVSLLDNNPAFKQILLEQHISNAKVELERAGRIPDITLGLGLRRIEENNENAMVVEMSVPLPLFDRNQHAIAEAIANQGRTKAKSRKFRAQAIEVLHSLYQELKHAEEELKTSEKIVIPKANETLKATRQGFEQGRYSYLELSDAQRIFLEAKRDYIDAAQEYQEQVVALESIIGSPFSSEKSAITNSGN